MPKNINFKYILIVFVHILCLACSSFAENLKNINYQNADLIFHTSKSNQSYAIMWASQSVLSHVGLIEKTKQGEFYVVEAISKVSRTPLAKWINRGRLDRYEVYRYKGLTIQQRKQIIENAIKYIGRPYDIAFNSQNEEIYCSELVAYAFNDSQIKIGHYQKVASLKTDNPVVKGLVKKRWKKHPVCKNKKLSFDQCWQAVLNDELITPVSLTQDPQVEKIYSNYN